MQSIQNKYLLWDYRQPAPTPHNWSEVNCVFSVEPTKSYKWKQKGGSVGTASIFHFKHISTLNLRFSEHRKHPNPQRSHRFARLERFMSWRWCGLANDPAGSGLRLRVLQEVQKMLISGRLCHRFQSKRLISKEDDASTESTNKYRFKVNSFCIKENTHKKKKHNTNVFI